MYKCASAQDFDSRAKAWEIMQEIKNENPSHWPNGISISGHDHLYLVKDSSETPVGFVGWQNIRNDQNEKIGYYTVGILSEHRKQGLAKEAVQKIISKHASECDRVCAYIKSTNHPSIRLANSLGVNIKEAAMIDYGNAFISNLAQVEKEHKNKIEQTFKDYHTREKNEVEQARVDAEKAEAEQLAQQEAAMSPADQARVRVEAFQQKNKAVDKLDFYGDTYGAMNHNLKTDYPLTGGDTLQQKAAFNIEDSFQRFTETGNVDPVTRFAPMVTSMLGRSIPFLNDNPAQALQSNTPRLNLNPSRGISNFALNYMNHQRNLLQQPLGDQSVTQLAGQFLGR